MLTKEPSLVPKRKRVDESKRRKYKKKTGARIQTSEKPRQTRSRTLRRLNAITVEITVDEVVTSAQKGQRKGREREGGWVSEWGVKTRLRQALFLFLSVSSLCFHLTRPERREGHYRPQVTRLKQKVAVTKVTHGQDYCTSQESKIDRSVWKTKP